MAFQFHCPQGHLLQGDASQAGQSFKCPYCDSSFLMPRGPAPTAKSSVEAKPADATPRGDKQPALETLVTRTHQQPLFHILCPSGHLLETPREMLGQDVLCPFCQAQFRLRLEDSVEHRREQDERREQREREIGQKWVSAAIIAAIVVLGTLFLLIGVMLSR